MIRKLYHIGGGVPEEDLFFGREYELRIVQRSLPANFLVLGGRMQGKTSFLKAIERRAPSWGWDCHYFHASNDFLARLEEVWERRKSRASIDPSDPRYHSDHPSVVLVDEAEDLIGHNQEQREEIFHLLGTMSNRGDDLRLCFVLAGGWSLAEASREWPFDNFGRVIRIGALSNKAAEELVQRPGDIGLQYDSAEVSRRIIVESGRQAHLMCLICNEIAERLRDSENQQIRNADIDEALRSANTHEKFFGWKRRLEKMGWPKWATRIVEKTIHQEFTFSLDMVWKGSGPENSQKGPPSLEDVDHLLKVLHFEGWLLPTGRGEFYYLPLFRAEVLRLARSQTTLQISSDEKPPERRFRVAVSFPGQHRDLVQQIADLLTQELGADAVFYDSYYVHELARPRLDVYLQDIYGKQADLIVAFVSAEYRDSEWCGLEWDAIRELIKIRRDEAVMVVKVGEGDIPGLLSNIGYVSARQYSPEEIASLIQKRLKLLEES